LKVDESPTKAIENGGEKDEQKTLCSFPKRA
jgi:hypothetical protein